MEKTSALQRNSPTARRAGTGGQDDYRARSFPKKAGTYRKNGAGSSFHEKRPKSSSRSFSKNPVKDSCKWQKPIDEFSKAPPGRENSLEPLADASIDEELTLYGSQKETRKNVNLQYTASNRHQCRPYQKYRPAAQYYARQSVYNKESYLQANCQFIVKDDGDYSLHTVDPDTLVDWDMIEQICLCSHEMPSCPICLDTPRVARITRCGHVYCWSCIIHYLQLGDKNWRKCPICYEAIIPSDLKSVITTVAHKFKAGETIEMKLMQRKKGSMLSKPISSESVSQTVEWKGDLGTIIRTVHAKLLKVSPKTVHEKILSLEMAELKEQLKEAKSEQSGEESFIEIAINLLQEKESQLRKKVSQCLKENHKADSIKVVAQPQEPCQTKKIMDVLQEQVEKASMDDPAFSDDEDTSIDEATSNLDGQSQHENVVELASNSESSDTATIKTASTPDCYYYYQAKDGQNIFLQPVNIRCLIHEYGSLQSCPEYISAQIIDCETYTMTKELRKRFRYLSHLPLSCEFTFCELMIRPPILSRETLSKFANEFYDRKMTRQRKKREERKLERKIEKSRTIDNFGRVVHYDTEVATTIDLQSLSDFPSQIGSAPIDAPVVSSPPGNTGSWGTSSFAKALQKTNQPPVQRKEGSWPRKTLESAPEREKTVPPDPLDEDYVPVPSFASAFSEAFSSAMETQGAATSGGANQKGKGKKQKGKKLLFTTSNGPKYS